jgi:hypothetical protein
MSNPSSPSEQQQPLPATPTTPATTELRRSARLNPESVQTPTPPVSQALPALSEQSEPSALVAQRPERHFRRIRDTTMSASPMELMKLFDGCPRLEKAADWKMWHYRVTSTLDVAWPSWKESQELEDAAERQTQATAARVVFISVTKTIDNAIMANYTQIKEIHVLISALERRYDLQTQSVTANSTSQLFEIQGHVAEFDKTLDKLEEVYANLCAHNKKPSDDIYVAAITKATPQQYKWVISQEERLIEQQNTFAKLSSKIEEETLTPQRLMMKLRIAFSDYVSNHTRKSRAAQAFPYRDEAHHPYFRGRGGSRARGRGQGRGRGRGRGGYHESQRKCYNCNKFGHIAPECRAPMTDETKKYLEEKKKKQQQQQHGHAHQAATVSPAQFLAGQASTSSAYEGAFIEEVYNNVEVSKNVTAPTLPEMTDDEFSKFLVDTYQSGEDSTMTNVSQIIPSYMIRKKAEARDGDGGGRCGIGEGDPSFGSI